MDLQKIPAQANNSIAQRPEGTKDGVSIFSTPFSDMVRLPLMMAGDLLNARSDEGSTLDRLTETHQQVDRPENHTPDSGGERQTHARDDAREDDSRSSENGKNRNDETDQRSNENRDEKDTKNLADNKDNDNTDQQRNSDESGATETAKSQSDEENIETETEIRQTAGDNSATHNTPDSSQDAHATDPSLNGLIAAAQSGHGSEAIENSHKSLKNAATNQNRLMTGAIDPASSGENAKSNSEHAQHAKQIQNALNRVGMEAANKAMETVKPTTSQPLAEQQAKALTEKIKPEKSVKVQVNVNNRAGTAVSQNAQSLNTNAVAAQEMGVSKNVQSNSSRGEGSHAQQRIFQGRVEGIAPSQGQTQATNQITQGASNSTNSNSFGRAVVQVAASNAQVNHSGGEGSSTANASISGNSQAIAGTQKAKQSQAARSPEQTRPLTQQISVNISKAVSEGLDRISIQLRPENLGRVEVKLELSQSGRVSATIIADRPEALELLRSDSRNLERALQEAGLDTHSGDLNFNLRDHEENTEEPESETHMAGEDDPNAEDSDLEVEIANSILNGDLDNVLNNLRVDIRA